MGCTNYSIYCDISYTGEGYIYETCLLGQFTMYVRFNQAYIGKKGQVLKRYIGLSGVRALPVATIKVIFFLFFWGPFFSTKKKAAKKTKLSMAS